MYNKIALAIAFSPTLEALICEAVRIQRLHNALLLLIHVGNESEEKNQQLNDLFDRHQIDREQVKVMWENGKPAKKILQVCKKEGVDLLMAGALKKEQLITYYLGSIARKIIRKSQCAVLILVKPSVIPEPFDKVVVNGTRHEQTPKIIRHAVRFCKIEKSKRVFILNEIKMYALQMTSVRQRTEKEVNDFRTKLVNEEIQYVNNALKELDTEGLKIDIKVNTDRWTTQLVEFSKNIHADLLIVGGLQRHYFFDLFFPHDLEDLLIDLPGNILIVK